MSVEIPLKLKYRIAKPKGTFRADYAGDSGKHFHGAVPVGIRKRAKGKAARRGLFGHL